jgi:hypothetical protein
VGVHCLTVAIVTHGATLQVQAADHDADGKLNAAELRWLAEETGGEEYKAEVEAAAAAAAAATRAGGGVGGAGVGDGGMGTADEDYQLICEELGSVPEDGLTAGQMLRFYLELGAYIVLCQLVPACASLWYASPSMI